MAIIRVVDNFLPQDYFANLQLMISDLPWFYHDWSVSQGDGDPQFYHLFHFDGQVRSPDWFKYVEDVFTRYVAGAQEATLYRMKLNATPKSDTIKEKEFHVDVEDREHRVCILYMNTCDGYTVFEEDGERVESVANRAVFFPGHLRHAGTNCTDQGLRIVLNLDYLK